MDIDTLVSKYRKIRDTLASELYKLEMVHDMETVYIRKQHDMAVDFVKDLESLKHQPADSNITHWPKPNDIDQYNKRSK